MTKQVLIVLSVFLIVFKSYSQQKDREHYIAFSAAADVRNLIGSKSTNNKSAFDLFFQASIITPVNVEINIGYESFEKLNFDKYTMGVGYHFPLYAYIGNKEIKTIFIPSIEPTLINRNGSWGGQLYYNQVSSHLSIGVNIAFRININDEIAIEYLFNALPRIDMNAKFPNESWHQKSTIGGVPIVGSNFIKICYKIQRGI